MSTTIPIQIGGSGADLVKYDKFREEIFADLHVGTIGVVKAISGSLLTVKPIISERAVADDGTISWLDLPSIEDVPYVGNEPKVGDSVVLLFLDCDISSWINHGGTAADGTTPTQQQQQILQYHSINNAVAICGFGSPNANVTKPANFGSISGSTTDNGIGVSDALVSFIKSWEGSYANWYNDCGGTPTIGYGHTGALPSEYTPPLSDTQQTSLLEDDLGSYISAVRSQFSGVTLNQHQFDALVDFAYNLGPGALNKSTLKQDIIAGADSGKLKQDFEAYSHVGSKLVTGLLHRRDAEWAMFCNAQYLSNG